MPWISAGHESGTRWTAEAVDVVVCQLDGFFAHKLVKLWGLDLRKLVVPFWLGLKKRVTEFVRLLSTLRTFNQ